MTHANQVDDVPEWGPAMAALSEKRRAFVIAMFDPDAPQEGRGLLKFAAIRAGYGSPTSSDNSIRVMASHLAHDPRIQAAAAEYAQAHIRALAPNAVRAVRDAIANPRHKDHIRATAMVLDRVDPLETTHTVRVEDHRPPSIEVTQKVLDRIEELMRRAGLAPRAPVIDGNFKVVEEAKG